MGNVTSLPPSLPPSLTQSLTHAITQSLTKSRNHSLTHAITHSLTQSRNHALTHSINHPPTLSAPNGHRVGTMNLIMRDSSAYSKQWQRTAEVQLTNDTHCLGLKGELWDTFVQGWGLLSQFSPFRYFPIFFEWSKRWLPVWYQVYIWQVSPQLSSGDTWQMWTWMKLSELYFS